ncbi:phage tail sheath family protein [Bacteroides intestinalis]|uniref:phage tail sheath family protein n=1 Tax=Bacteroides intestinalis TaxID=329854 RepID=UPI001E38CB2B|nr:phage tail sheath C-terminal domain-containing protein [Bacteroides intestinalis]
MGEYKTPGVYIKEKNAFPNSVVEAETAIPAFIGYTEKTENGNDSLKNKPFKISSMTEYVKYFGGAPSIDLTLAPVKYHVGLTEEDLATMDDESKSRGMLKPTDTFFQYDIEDTGQRETLTFKLKEGETKGESKEYPVGVSITVKGENKFTLYYNMMLFFANGGGTCYIVSVGDYDNSGAIDRRTLSGVLDELKLEQEITMVVVPEAVNIKNINEFKGLQTDVLQHCGKVMKNRIALLDIFRSADGGTDIGSRINSFHEGIGSEFLSYGAAYFPWLNTSVLSSRDIKGEKVDWTVADVAKYIDLLSRQGAVLGSILGETFGFVKLAKDENGSPVVNGVKLSYETVTTQSLKAGLFNTWEIEDVSGTEKTEKIKKFSFAKNGVLLFHVSMDEKNVVTLFDTQDNPVEGIEKIQKLLSDTASICSYMKNDTLLLYPPVSDTTARESLHLALLGSSAVYKDVVKGVLAKLNLLPPSAAMAGIYTMVDNTRGVWKAPANVTLNYVSSPEEDIDDEQQQDLNAPVNGKTINVIRTFRGEGVKVWGARTLDGNSLDWRYINVRRTLLFLEESVKNAARAYVFEPNDAGTWINMKCMIDSFLRSVWKRGGLAGATPEDAFEVHVGLGDTMTGDDILEGIMRITVLVAVTHPAEFIEITFQQQMQKS